jgi:cation diffusion facilitator family transporter
MSAQGDSLKTILYALVANGSIAVAKAVAALITGSGAMFAEAIHSAADCANQLLLLLGMRQSKQAPNDDYPLGYGKETYFWSFIVAIMLFSLGGLFSIYEGVHKLQHAEPLQKPWVAISVLVFAIVAESISMWGCLREVNKSRGNRSLWQWFRETRQSELLVVFGEDLAALLGLVFALAAVVLSMVTGNPVFDAVGGIVIGGFLIVIAVLVGVEVKALLVGQGVDPQRKQEMLAFLSQQLQVEKVLNLLTLQMGAEVMVAVKVKMTECESVSGLLDQVNEVEVSFRQAFPETKWLFFEPDIKD